MFTYETFWMKTDTQYWNKKCFNDNNPCKSDCQCCRTIDLQFDCRFCTYVKLKIYHYCANIDAITPIGTDPLAGTGLIIPLVMILQ